VSDTNSLEFRLRDIQNRVDSAARSANRDPEDVTLIVVTKFHPASLVRELYDLGVRDVGENRHQEASLKAQECADLDLTWHFIGQLQSNKARAALEYADVIHSVDRPSLVVALTRAWLDGVEQKPRNPVDCFLQLNLTDDPGRGGVQKANLLDMAQSVLESPALNLLGVMSVAPLEEDPARAFDAVADASALLRTLAPEATFISAGMSQDFAQAISIGATHLRIGTAITGNRPVSG
jgi:pyridoxal phosphate enzyme (YggS family)